MIQWEISRILKWRYVSTIFLAIFGGYIPLHSPYIGLIYGRYLQWIGSWNGHWMMKPFTSFAPQQLPDFRVPALFLRSGSGTRGLGSGNDTFSYPTVTAVGNHPMPEKKTPNRCGWLRPVVTIFMIASAYGSAPTRMGLVGSSKDWGELRCLIICLNHMFDLTIKALFVVWMFFSFKHLSAVEYPSTHLES